MMNTIQSRTLSILGTLLILCGLIAILVIGSKAKNMMLAGVLTGLASWVLSWLAGKGRGSVWAGVGLALATSALFGQRAVANLLALIGIVQHEMNLDAYNKCITVVLLMIMCMASVSTLMILFSNIQPSEQR